MLPSRAALNHWVLPLFPLLVTACAGSQASTAPARQPAGVQAETPQAVAPSVKQVFCNSTVTEWDEHRCIEPYAPGQERKRQLLYRLTYENGHAVRFERINSRGFFPTGDEVGEVVRWDYTFENGRVAGGRGYDAAGILRRTFVLSPDRRDYRELDAWGRPGTFSNKSRAVTNHRTFDSRGRVTSYMLLDRADKPVPRSNGVVLTKVVRDERGAQIEESYFDERGAPMLDDKGVHMTRRVPGPYDETLEERDFGIDGQPTTNVYGVHFGRQRFDDVGNAVEDLSFGLKDEPIDSSDSRAFQWRARRNEFGEPSYGAYFGVHGEPVVSEWGYHEWKRAFDDKGRTVEWAFLGPFGEPMSMKEGHFIKRRSYTEQGWPLLDSYYDGEGKPFKFWSGYGAFRTTYDARGNVLREDFLDLQGQLVNYSRTYASRVVHSNEFDQIVRIDFLDKDGQPANNWTGFASTLFEYDEKGALVDKTFVDAERGVVERGMFTAVRIGFTKDDAAGKLPEAAKKQLAGLREGAVRSLNEARKMADAARTALLEGRPGEVVARLYSDKVRPGGDSPRREMNVKDFPESLRSAWSLARGAVSTVEEGDGELWVIRREDALD